MSKDTSDEKSADADTIKRAYAYVDKLRAELIDACCRMGERPKVEPLDAEGEWNIDLARRRRNK